MLIMYMLMISIKSEQLENFQIAVCLKDDFYYNFWISKLAVCLKDDFYYSKTVRDILTRPVLEYFLVPPVFFNYTRFWNLFYIQYRLWNFDPLAPHL